MAVRISTGGEMWALIQMKDKRSLIEEVRDKYLYARQKWPDQRTTISGLPEKEIEEIKKYAHKNLKEMNNGLLLA